MRLWDSVKAAASGVEDDGTYDSPNSAENSAARRAAAFKVTSEDLGLSADWGSEPFGVIIETSGPRGVSTLAAYANGDASLLYENGSGIIGRPSHVHVVNQAKRLVACAEGLGPLLSRVDGPSRPPAGTSLIYLLTGQSLLSTRPVRPDERGAGSPWSPVMEVADELLSEFAQYLRPDLVPVGPPRLVEYIKSLAIAAVIGGLTYAAWLIPIPWIRWPLVGIGLFLTAAALFVFYAVLAGPRDDADEADTMTAR
jgi:hypothetical protein